MPAPKDSRREPSDEQLATRLQQGDRASGDVLMERHHRLVARTIHEVIRDTHAVEDLMQEIFMKIFRKIDLFQPDKGKFLPWLVTVARNEALNHLRGRKRGTHVSIHEAAPDGGLAPIDSPSRQVSKKEVSGRLMDAINKMPEPERTILTLRILQGKSFEQIARTLKQPLDTVKTIFYRNAELLKSTTETPYHPHWGLGR